MAPYTPFIGKPQPLGVKPVINPLVKSAVSQPQQAGQPMQRNPALSILTRGNDGGGLIGREPGASGVGGIPTMAGPTSADILPVKKPTAEDRLAHDTAAGYENADKYGIGKEGSMGRLNDERKGEIDALLAKQKAGMDGMTPQEMQAAREQGGVDINRQLAQNMSQFGDMAAGNGVRGGSAMGLQMQAMAGAQEQSGTLARKLIMDNVAQKNIAMDRYGQTLGQQQGVGLGIQDSNNQSANAEKLARELAAGNYTSQMDSYASGDKADDFTQQGLDIAKRQVELFGETGGYAGGGPGGTGSGTAGSKGKVKLASGQEVDVVFNKEGVPVNPTTGERVYGKVVTGSGTGKQGSTGTTTPMKDKDGKTVNVDYGEGDQAFDRQTGRPVTVDDKGKAHVEPGHTSNSDAPPRKPGDPAPNKTYKMEDGKSYVTNLPPGMTPDQVPNQKKLPDGTVVYDLTSSTAAGKAAAQAARPCCIITTEAIEQGLLDPKWANVTSRYKLMKMGRDDISVYWEWAEGVVARMKASRLISLAVAKVLPGTLAAMACELNLMDKAPLHGKFFFGLYKALNAYYRPIVHKRNGQQMTKEAVERLYRMRAVN